MNSLKAAEGKSRTVNKLFLLKNIYKEVLKEECTDDQFSSLSTYISYLKNRMIPMDKWAS